MTQLQRQIRSAQHLLWLNRWLYTATYALAVGAGVMAGVVLIQRLFDWPMPLMWIAVSLLVCSIFSSLIWTWVSRENQEIAAAKLDEAAGLRERISSGHYCANSDDPFARAVLADAESISRSISARSHIRVKVPAPLGWSVLSMLIAACMLLITPGLLASSEVKEAKQKTVELYEAKVAVKKKMDKVRKMVQANPAMADMEDELDDLDMMAGGKLTHPSDIRHESIKKLEKLSDAVKQKRDSAKYDVPREMRKMLRGLKIPKSSQAPTQKLANALLKGDFKTAKQEINKLKEQLATLKSEEDKQMVEEMSKQLSQLAKQLEKLASDKKLQQKLKDAGLTDEEVKRILENLKKDDIEQIKKDLAKKGLDQKTIEKLAKQLKQNQQAGSIAKKLAQGMKKASQGAKTGQTGEAMSGLSAAADQLSELEQLEQEMNQLDSAMADLQNAKDSLDNACSKCNGSGSKNGKSCSKCNGSGQKPGSGMGRKMGQGRGGLAPEKESKIAFKTERGKVKTGKGAIIGQFLIDGEQVKGESTRSVREVIISGEQEASDRINRNRIPRQYHKAVKSYFSTVQKSMKDAKLKPPGSDSELFKKTESTPSSSSTDENKDGP